MAAYHLVATPPVQGNRREPPALLRWPASRTRGELARRSEANRLVGGSMRARSATCVDRRGDGTPSERAVSRPA
jgi:hypothetical protein